MVGFAAMNDPDAEHWPSRLLVYSPRLIEQHEDWRVALDLQNVLNKKSLRRECTYGLTVAIVDESDAFAKTHTKQAIVDGDASARRRPSLVARETAGSRRRRGRDRRRGESEGGIAATSRPRRDGPPQVSGGQARGRQVCRAVLRCCA